MARNGAGTYSLPAAYNPVVTNTPISISWANTTLNDVATALSGSIAANGETTITADLPMATFKHTGVGNAVLRTQYSAAGQIQDGSFIWCGTAGGTADAITLTASPVITAVTAGMTLRFKAGASGNTGAMTVAIGGAASIAIQNNGAACVAGAVVANKWYQITVDASGTSCQLLQLGYPTQGQIGSGPITCTSITNSGNLAFTGTGNLITGDFSNATFANRPKFQSSAAGGTLLTVIPGSAGSVSTVELWSSTNGSTGSVCYTTISDGNYSEIITTHGGAGSYLPFRVRVGGLISTIHQTSGLLTTNYGIDNTSTTDASSSVTGSVKTAGGMGVAKALYVGTNLVVAGTASTIAPESVIAPTLINSWVNFGGSYLNAGFWKDALGVVHIQGTIKTGTSGTVAYVLPVGYRPTAQALFIINSNVSTSGYVLIDASGNVTVVGTTSSCYMDGLSFRTT